MKLTNEVLSEKNENEVFNFMKQNGRFFQDTCGWDTGRFVDWSWGYNNLNLQENRNWFAENSRIFRKNGTITAVLIAEEGEDDFCILPESKEADTVREVLKWISENWVSLQKGLSFELNESAAWMTDVLKEKGYVEEKNTGNEWEYDLTSVSTEVILPEGFTIESITPGDTKDMADIAGIFKEAFEMDDTVEQLVFVQSSLQENPLFKPELNLIVRSPEGRAAAYCRGTINFEGSVCGIDPVCCHSDFRKKGLSKAVVRECFKRMFEMGGKSCFIGSMPKPAASTFLYQSLGPANVVNDSCWCLDIED